ncbi:nephrin-like isoform X1 [Uloborus diversus]|uniref:nephrin-like isoform X1 n=1 Tax=Uloborus diversus TaxID=327109 RepID=UPI002409F4D1|nr:nephrin-like isoform X1 [Uloborus diversus]
MAGKYAVMVVLTAMLMLNTAGERNNSTRNREYSEHTAVIGTELNIPCNVTAAIPDDQVTLILWYRGDSGNPIYSVDTRQAHGVTPKKFSNKHLEGRATFSMNRTLAILNIKPVKDNDGGEYRCRVDYRRSRTMNSVMKVIVVVPPKNLTIRDSKNNTVSGVIGPYEEGATVSLICEASGGRPTPNLSWWKGSTLLDNSFTTLGRGLVINELLLLDLQREDLLTMLTCQASNTNLTVPVSSSVTIDLSLSPQEVRITTPRRPLSSGEILEVVCQTFGSRPPSKISWWIGQESMTAQAKEIVSGDGNVTTSRLQFRPTSEEHGKFLICRAHNPETPDSALEDKWELSVYFQPQLSLALGASQQYEHIREGSDVYFDCNIQANPPVTSVIWRFQSRPLEHNPAMGIIVRNHSLLLQNVGRRNRGTYRCMATNQEGEGVSEEALLMIQFSPVCISGLKRMYGVAKHEEINITCELDADPDDIQFRWIFNNTSETIDIITFTTDGMKSIASYIPRSKMDYGTLSCWGRNSIGVQRHPCVFTIMPAGPPDPLQNCSLLSHSSTTFTVNCTPGIEDGGLKPRFHLLAVSIRDSKDHLNISVTNDKPLFDVRGLDPGTTYELILYASNAKGRSTTLELLATTLYALERRTGEEPTIAISAVLAVLMGLVAALVLLAIVIIFVVKSRHSSDSEAEQGDNNEKIQTPKLKHFEDDSPDVIPSKPFCTDYSSLAPNSTNDIIYENVQEKEHTYANMINRVHFVPSEPYDDITYAELALPDSQQPYARHRLDPPTEYADIDFQNSRGTFATTTVLGNEEDSVRSPLVISNKPIRVIPEECQPSLGAV